MKDHNLNYEEVDEFVINCYNLNSGCCFTDYAWGVYYNGITLLLNKRLLNDLNISNYSMLADEICIDDRIDIRKYLEYVSVRDIELVNDIKYLLEKYHYDCPVIEFSTGQIIEQKKKVKRYC